MYHSKSIINKNLKLLEHIRDDYNPIECDNIRTEYIQVPSPHAPHAPRGTHSHPSTDDSIYNNTNREDPQLLKYYIDHESGKVVITDKRYLRLGKLVLYDSIKDEPFDEDKYIAILDTHYQILHCFNVQHLYDNYVSKEKDRTTTRYGSFDLSESTKSIVLGEIFK